MSSSGSSSQSDREIHWLPNIEKSDFNLAPIGTLLGQKRKTR